MDSFIALWRNIANQHTFLRLTLPTDTPTEADIRRAIKQRMGEMSPYSSDFFEEYRVVYHAGQTMVVTHRKFHSVGTFFAIPDSESPHRFFIGFAFSVGPTTESVAGLFVYFTEEGQKIEVCDRVLFTYDLRNGYIRGKDGHLYHQSLFFTQSHRDTGRMILYAHHIDYETDRLDGSTMVYTDYTVRDIYHRERFLYFSHLSQPLYRLIDLGSLAIKEESKDRHLTFSMYVVKAPQLERFLDIAASFPERQYSDGYPLTCIRCHLPTHAANYGYKVSLDSTYEVGLGCSYCPSCHIRYSLSKAKWVCTRIESNGKVCEGLLLPTLLCPKEHNTQGYDCIIHEKSRQAKYPHRNIYVLRWIPPMDTPADSPSSMSPLVLPSPALPACLPVLPALPAPENDFFLSAIPPLDIPLHHPQKVQCEQDIQYKPNGHE